jgi:hypothetical protein
MKLPHHIDPRNLLTLRWDLRSGLFDKAYFVIAPQFGELRVHFLQHSEEGGQRYHDVPFNADSISLELLRALMKIVCDMDLDSESFRFLEVDKLSRGRGKLLVQVLLRKIVRMMVVGMEQTTLSGIMMIKRIITILRNRVTGLMLTWITMVITEIPMVITVRVGPGGNMEVRENLYKLPRMLIRSR